MEDEITTETKPRLFKSGHVLPVDALIADPSITIIEIGETLGFLLSESCYDSETGNFILENVTWCRYIVQKRESVINRSFSNNATINQATDAKLNQAIDSHEDQHNTPQKKAYPAWR